MADRVETHPYEILIRFTWDAGEVAGAVRGMQVAQRRYLVSADGTIKERLETTREDLAREFPRDTLLKFLGERMIATEEQRKKEATALEAAAAAIAERDETITQLQQSEAALAKAGIKAADALEVLNAERAALVERLATAEADKSALRSDMAGAAAQIKKLEAKVADCERANAALLAAATTEAA